MTAIISKIKSKANVQQLPVTHERAVRDDNGTTLETKLQMIDSHYNKDYEVGNGMGKKTLPKNNGVLTQAMMPIATGQNTKYVIRYDYTLGENITVPENCVLEFDGGSINGNGTNKNTITCTDTRITGYNCFDKTIILTGTIAGDIIEFDWWKNEKVSLTDYTTFIADGYLSGSIPTISDTNRIILTKIISLGMVKFGKGIYPFDSSMTFSSLNICADCEFDTLLWAPLSDFAIIGNSINGIIRGLHIEALGNCIKCYSTISGSGIHRYEISDSTLISYTDHCVAKPDEQANKTIPYGWLFENIKIYAGPNKSAIYNMSSNSMTYHNVVDAHLYFSCAKTRMRGLMHSMFYNSNIQSFDNSNMTYAGWKYFYYADKIRIYRCCIHNCTFEGGDNAHNNIANIVRIDAIATYFELSIHNITLISTNFDIAPIYINSAQGGYIDAPQINTIYFGSGNAGKWTNYGNMIYFISDNIDTGGTRRRVGIIYPTKNPNFIRTSIQQIDVSNLQNSGFPSSIIDVFTEEGYTGLIYFVLFGNACDIFKSGSTGARPTGIGSGNTGSLIPSQDEGFEYFDITLGKPVYAKSIAANGTITWVDSLGNPANTNYQSSIDASHKLSADFVDDTSSTNKFGSSITGTAGNLAGFDVQGKLADSGSKPSDFEPASA